MDKNAQLKRLLSSSSDPANPSAEELEHLLGEVRHIAVIGLSRYLEKAARRVPSYLAAKGYDVIPVNPNAERLLGRQSYPALSDVPSPVDMVVIFRPSEVAGEFVQQAAEHPDAPAVWLQSGIRADGPIEELRAEGRVAVQDLCIFRVHRTLVA